MIRTEMSRCPLPVSGGVEHAAEAGRVDRPAVYTEADQAPRALVHDHEHPVALEHDGLAAKQVDAPETVRRVTDERQPGRPGAARGGSIVFRQHASDDVLVDVDAERLRDDACNAWTAEPRISRFELNDRPDERVARPLRSRRPRAMARREQAPVLPMHQRPMKRQQCRGADANGDLSEPPRPEKEGPNPQRRRSTVVKFGARFRGRRRTISCCFSKRFSAITARTPPGRQSFAAVTARWSRVSTTASIHATA